MKRFNAHNIRNLIEKARHTKTNIVLTKAECDNYIADLADMLLYICELEERLQAAEKTISVNTVEVEMIGDKF